MIRPSLAAGMAPQQERRGGVVLPRRRWRSGLLLVLARRMALLISGAVTAAHAQGGAAADAVRHSAAAAGPSSGRPITVADIIGLTRIGSRPGADIDVRSADGCYTAVVLRRGDLERNTNVYTLVVFRSDSLWMAARPDTVLSFATASNGPGIAQLQWLGGNHTLAFLGERSDSLSYNRRRGSPQVYTVDVRTHHWTQWTHHTTPITAFNVTPDGSTVLYSAEPPSDTTEYATWRRQGFVVRRTQGVSDLLTGQWAIPVSNVSLLFLMRRGIPEPLAVPGPGSQYDECWDGLMSLSPAGTSVVLACEPSVAPRAWGGYADPAVHRMVEHVGAFPQYLVLDLRHGTVEPLLNAPAIYPNYGGHLVWAPDGGSVVLGNTYLPLEGVDAAEAKWRTTHRAVAQVNVRTHAVTVVSRRDSLDVGRWDPVTNTLVLVPGVYGVPVPDAHAAHYRWTVHGWAEVSAPRRGAPMPELRLDEGMNRPPTLVAVAGDRAVRRVVLDPNPGLLQRLRFGREAVVHWTTAGGAHWDGGLYLPPNYEPRHRYPLVIQTHGFDSTAFWPDGPGSTAYAAQPLASAGIVVLQLDNSREASVLLGTSGEAPMMQEGIEAAIEHLDSSGLIDRSRVGLIGFSRTCYHVLYVLTHSRYRVAAAAISDGVDLGYLQYVLFGVYGQLGAEHEAINGGRPWGPAFTAWRERAAGFNLDHLTTPLRLEAIGLGSILGEWEPYAGLLLQHKAAELFVIPEGSHLLVRPLERLASQGGNADWFRFWLKGEEDPDPAKREQYARWRELRKLYPQPVGDKAVTQHGLE